VDRFQIRFGVRLSVLGITVSQQLVLPKHNVLGGDLAHTFFTEIRDKLGVNIRACAYLVESCTNVYLCFCVVYAHVQIFLFVQLYDILVFEAKRTSPTEAQIRARKKYREKQEYLQTRVSPEEKLAIAEHVNTTNESLSDFIRRAIAETIELDKASTLK